MKRLGILHAAGAKKKLAVAMLWLLGLLPLTASSGVVLLYHHVDTKTPAITSITPDAFLRQLNIIEEEGFQVVSLRDLVTRSLAGKADEKLIAITFDDAYISVYNTAAPLLRARNWPYTVFVATGQLASPHRFYMNWDQLKELSEGGATIANHSITHSHLIRRLPEESVAEWQARVLDEISGAEQSLSEHGFAEQLFAYPYGEYNLWLLEQLARLGFLAFGQHSGAIGQASHPQLLPRFPVFGTTFNEGAFRDKIRSLALPLQFPEIEPLTTAAHPALQVILTDDSDPTRLTCYGPGGLMQNTYLDPRTVSVRSVEPLPTGRSRYNCTLPSSLSDATGRGPRFHWFSQLWIRKQADGSWYPEP